NLALTQGEEKQMILGCYHGKATMSGGSRLLPLDLKLRDVTLEYTYAQGLRPSSGQFQLFIPKADEQTVNQQPPTSIPTPPVVSSDTLSLLGPQHPPAASSFPAETPAANASIQIDRATIIGGQLYFEDRTVSPPQTVYWQDVRVDLSRVGYPVVLPATFS